MIAWIGFRRSELFGVRGQCSYAGALEAQHRDPGVEIASEPAAMWPVGARNGENGGTRLYRKEGSPKGEELAESLMNPP